VYTVQVTDRRPADVCCYVASSDVRRRRCGWNDERTVSQRLTHKQTYGQTVITFILNYTHALHCHLYNTTNIALKHISAQCRHAVRPSSPLRP